MTVSVLGQFAIRRDGYAWTRIVYWLSKPHDEDGFCSDWTSIDLQSCYHAASAIVSRLLPLHASSGLPNRDVTD